MHGYAEKLERMGLPVKPDLVVDDHLEVAAALRGIWVRSYYFPNACDDEMEQVYRIIAEKTETGHYSDPRFRTPSRR